MSGPFSHSLHFRFHSLTLLFAILTIAGAGFGAKLAFHQSTEYYTEVAKKLSSNANSIAATEIVRNKDNYNLSEKLKESFGGDDGLYMFAISKTTTGEVLASSSNAIDQLPADEWKEALKSGKDTQSASCLDLLASPIISSTAPVTNLVWNLFDSKASCLGSNIRAAELVTIGNLPKSLSGRTIVPMTNVYYGSALVGAGLIALLLGLLFHSLYFHRKVVSPLKTIKRGALIMTRGDLSHRIKISNKDEIGVVANFINEVGRNLQKVKNELIDRQRIASELDAAAKIQQHLIPESVPSVPGLDIAARTRSSTEVGGDNYGFHKLDEENMLIFIGDVTGHGVPAGLVMIMIDILIDVFSTIHTSPKDVMVNVNRYLTPNIDSTMFMTMIMLGFNIKTQRLVYASAGHEHIVHYHATTKRCTVTRSGGIALGMVPEIDNLIQETEIPLEIGDVIVLYTDGITEAYGGVDGNDMYGLERFVANIEKGGYRSSQGLHDALTRDLSNFMGGAPQNDDITLLILKYVGATESDIDQAKKRIKITVGEDEDAKSKKWEWDKEIQK